MPKGMMSKQLRNWIGSNAAFALAVYVGVWLDIEFVGYCVAIFVWIMFVAYAMALYNGDRTTHSRPVPAIANLLFDIAILSILVLSNWPATATGYALSVLAHEAVLRNAGAPPDP